MQSSTTKRYEHLCKLNDIELRLALQNLNIHHSTFGLTDFDPPPTRSTDDDFDPFSLFSPSPRQLDDPQPLSQDTVLNSSPDPYNVPTSVMHPLLCAAFATRPTPDQNPPLPDAHPGPSSSIPAQQNHTDPNFNMSSSAPTHHHQPSAPSQLLISSNSPSFRPPSANNGPARANPPATSFQTARSRLLRSRLNVNRNVSSNTLQQQPQSSSYHPASSFNRQLLNTKRRRTLQPSPTTPSLQNQQKPEQLLQRQSSPEEPELPEVPNVDPKLVQMIMNETLEKSPGVDWDDIAGLKFAKQCVMEAVVWPMMRPDIFSGLRGPPKGLLLFGPPGTGKTMIGRAIASKSGARFFNISASSLVSKWAGEGEKTVRALFGVARIFQPSVVFIDEIDSLLTQRTDGEQEHTRRIKTEFLVQMDGAGTSREDRILVVGATNRPQELDEAARRRLVKRLYIPLPDIEARCSLINKLMQRQSHCLSEQDITSIAKLSDGYSGSDMYALCAEAALGPVRDLGDTIQSIDASNVRGVNMEDFRKACRMVRASVSKNDLEGYVEWNESFGSFSMKEHTDDGADTGGSN